MQADRYVHRKTKLKNFEIDGLMTDYIPTDEELEKSFAKLPNKK